MESKSGIRISFFESHDDGYAVDDNANGDDDDDDDYDNDEKHLVTRWHSSWVCISRQSWLLREDLLQIFQNNISYITIIMR